MLYLFVIMRVDELVIMTPVWTDDFRSSLTNELAPQREINVFCHLSLKQSIHYHYTVQSWDQKSLLFMGLCIFYIKIQHDSHETSISFKGTMHHSLAITTLSRLLDFEYLYFFVSWHDNPHGSLT